jgi:hypothetical protein
VELGAGCVSLGKPYLKNKLWGWGRLERQYPCCSEILLCDWAGMWKILAVVDLAFAPHGCGYGGGMVGQGMHGRAECVHRNWSELNA